LVSYIHSYSHIQGNISTPLINSYWRLNNIPNSHVDFISFTKHNQIVSVTQQVTMSYTD